MACKFILPIYTTNFSPRPKRTWLNGDTTKEADQDGRHDDKLWPPEPNRGMANF